MLLLSLESHHGWISSDAYWITTGGLSLKGGDQRKKPALGVEERERERERLDRRGQRKTMKVIEKINAASKEENQVLFSFEYFPPRTHVGADRLLQQLDRMSAHSPAYWDITWRDSAAKLSLEMANVMQNIFSIDTMMHLTCTKMSIETIDHALQIIKSQGIQNVLALRGDPPLGQDKFVKAEGGFESALDLVKHVRNKHGDYFGVTVAGYPEAHPDVPRNDDGLPSSEGYQNDLVYLKRKVDAGAELIITQLFFDTNIFLKFVNDCRQIGINCPIVPGIFPISDMRGFLKMTSLCKTKIPSEITAALESIKDNEEAVRAYGIHLGTEICKKILGHGIKTLHFYTINKEKPTLSILMNLGLISERKVSRPLSTRQEDIKRMSSKLKKMLG
ncbi:hypothetical protein NE237_007106 [Protea cynaroides]|uniref:Methylenetetrahydrofolate reductase n=1 Tax=Protea cynaroides TaxID=273540 RepID=A0A9Q0QW32_9MAGN|nr:hypothetical protein NE237_007106 [Protea cynaroides]